MKTALPPEDTLLLASTAAALARRGWPAAKTAALLAEALPHGPARAELTFAAQALARGESLPAQGALTTTTLLARGEVAGADSLAELAHAHALEMRARRLAAAGIAYPVAGAAFGVVLIVVGGYVARTSEKLYDELGAVRSGAADMTHGLLGIASTAGWIVAIVSVIGVIAAFLGRGFLPGVTSMRAASVLRRLAAALAAGVAEPEAFALARADASGFDSLGLRERERALATRLASLSGTQAAARSLAEELERDAREASRMWRLLLPYAGIAGLLVVFVLLAVSLIAPIFLITGIF